MDYTALDDENLLRLIERENADALSILYDRHSRLVFGIALQMVGDHATAEEIVLDVFTRVWQKAASYQSERAKVSVWLASMARHRAIDLLRRRKVRPDYQGIDLEMVAGQVTANNGDPENHAVRSMERQRIRDALAALPKEQQQVIVLAYFKGYTQREIASNLDVPLGTVKTRVRLAMTKLKDMLGDGST